MIKDLREGSQFKGLLLVSQTSRGVTNSGDPYLNLTLQDSSGSIEAKKWKVSEEELDLFENGNVVNIEGEVYLYKTELQLKVLKAEKAELEIGQLDDFLPSAPVPRDTLLDKFTNYLNKIDNPEILSVINEIFKDILTSFSIYPAASKNHHSYVGGLLYHTVSMLDAGDALLKVYPTLDKNYLYAGIMLHDVGKIEELSGPVVTKYTTSGKLLGHISIVCAKVREACDKLNISEEVSLVLQHLVLSHHGTKEFGSPIQPLTKEALVLHALDDLDSKLNMVDKCLEDVEEGDFSSKQGAMENRTFFKPHKTGK